ncbi:MAG TPA: ComEA family DNA-binding protein [Candidatus Yaniella excrementigallinarum]|nr:ComEA family DNA-binding protein [Candidatus Yaniella excrementigallinarum]
MGKHLVEPNEHQPKAPIWRTRVALSAVLMLAIAVLTFFGFRWLITDQPATKGTTLAVDQDGVEDSEAPFDDPAKPNDAEEPGANSPADTLVLHVAGEVHDPGIVELSSDIRVIDAIKAAGGPTDNAALDALNLAAVTNDGDYIFVPDEETAQTNPDISTGANSANQPQANTDPAGLVNISTADAAELETLPGIGPATAAQIIEHREQHGAFADLASLEEVSGIGPATRERLDGLVSW